MATDWLLRSDGTWMPLTEHQAKLIDYYATMQDAVEVISRLAFADQALHAAVDRVRTAVGRSRAQRRIRRSGLRLVTPSPA